jgi:hypothetical protein
VSLASSTSAATANGTNTLVLATYKGGTNFIANYGQTIIDGATIRTGSVEADQLAVNSVLASKMVLADLSNLVINNWTDGTSDSWAASTGPIMFDAKADSNAIAAGFPGWGIRQPGDGGWVRSSSSTCSAGEKFYVELWIFRNSNLAASQTLLQVRWNIVESDGSETAAYSSVQGTTATGGFVRLSGIVTAPAGARLCSIWIRPTTSNISSSHFVSMFRPVLRRATSAELIVNGSVTADKLAVNELSAITANIGTLRSATTGARFELRSTGLRLYDSSNVLRVSLEV